MYKLDFTSSRSSSKHPVKVSEAGSVGFYKQVRKTEVSLIEITEVRDGADKVKVAKVIKTASVVCHPKETDYPLLGKKYAVAKLCDTVGKRKTGKQDEAGNDVYKRTTAGQEMREQIWDAFRAHSKKASCIAGCPPEDLD